MKKILLLIIGITIVILENTITNYIDLLGISFNLLIIYITIISLYLDKLEIGIIAAILGLIRDITVGGIFGLNGTILFFIAYCISHLSDKIYKENYITILVLIFTTTLFDSMINIGVVGELYVVDSIELRIIRGILIYPFINGLMGVLVYRLSKKSIVKLKES